MKTEKIKEILTEADIKFTENRSHIMVRVCPNCGGEDKLWLDKKVHLWQCFKCKGDGNDDTKSGNLFKFFTKVVGLDSYQTRTLLRDGEEVQYVPAELPPYTPPEPVSVEPKKLPQFDLPSNHFRLDCSEESFRRFPQAYRYLFSRNVTSKAVIRKFDLRFDTGKSRLIFPAYVEQGHCIGYQGRDITDRHKQKHPKCVNYQCYLFNTYYFVGEEVAPAVCPRCGGVIELAFYPKSSNSKHFPKMEFFFNQHNVDWSQPVVLVEGPFDVINTPNAIGLMGRALSDQQFHILRERCKSLILYLDGDSSGTDSIQEIYRQIALFIPTISICFLEDGQDPGSYSLADNTLKLKTLMTMQEWCVRKNLIYLY